MIVELNKPECDKIMNEQGGLFKLNPAYKGNGNYIGSIGDKDYFLKPKC